LTASLLLLLLDLALGLVMRGLAPPLARTTPATLAIVAIAFAAAMPSAGARAADTKTAVPVDASTAAAILETRLAYVVTGDAAVARGAAAGRGALTEQLAARPAAELGKPEAVNLNAGNLSADSLSPFPLIYWHIAADEPVPNAKAVAALNAYCH